MGQFVAYVSEYHIDLDFYVITPEDGPIQVTAIQPNTGYVIIYEDGVPNLVHYSGLAEYCTSRNMTCSVVNKKMTIPIAVKYE